MIASTLATGNGHTLMRLQAPMTIWMGRTRATTSRFGTIQEFDLSGNKASAQIGKLDIQLYGFSTRSLLVVGKSFSVRYCTLKSTSYNPSSYSRHIMSVNTVVACVLSDHLGQRRYDQSDVARGPFIYYVSTFFLSTPTFSRSFWSIYLLHELKISNYSMKISSNCKV